MAFDPCCPSGAKPASFSIQDFMMLTNLEDVTCPICLDYPHNSVLLLCSSHDKGCSPFVCNTDHLLSNCLNRLKMACGMSDLSASTEICKQLVLDDNAKLSCPLCRGEVTGWMVDGKARTYLDEKKRACEEKKCTFSGSYAELRKHAMMEHPHACPSRIDPARQLDWDNFQQSSEIIDVLSTIHSEVPHGVVLGDYVIEYGVDEMAEQYDDFARDGKWWTSCILYKVFYNFRNCRSRRRSRRSQRDHHYSASNSDDSVASIEFPDYRLDEPDDGFPTTAAPSWASNRSSRRRRSRFQDN